MMTLIVIGLILGCSGWYSLSCWRWPLADCWCCDGKGKHARKDGKVFRRCRWCRGSGHRWRIGRRVYRFFRKRAHT